MRRIHVCLSLALFLGLLSQGAGLLAKEPAVGLPVVPATEAGLKQAPLDQIASKLKAAVEAQQISGAVTLVAYQGKIVSLEAVGMADIEGKRPMTKDSLFRIASMTKPIAAAALMILQDEGKLSIDDPVSKYIPQFKEVKFADGKSPAREITLKDVLTHTSGVVGSQAVTGSLKETAEELAKRPLSFEPGSKWSYSPGLNIVGRVVEVVSGQSFEKFVQSRILEPLGMSDTSFHPSEAQFDRMTVLYKLSKDNKTLETVPTHGFKGTLSVPASPSGGLFSTASDIARFYQMMLNGGEYAGTRILSEKAVKQMTSLQTGEIVTGFTPGNGWGLGFCLVQKPQGVTASLSPGSFGHGGAFGTQSWADPERKMIFVLMIQRSNLGNSDASDLRGIVQTQAVEALKK